MSITINTNSAATVAAYNLRGIGAEYQRNLTRLTTGLRINSSSDDAAGMAVSMKMSAQIRRADAYSANIANSRSFLQTQDTALAQLGKLLERMSELKALAHDVTKNGGDVDLYEKEYIQLQTQFAQTSTEQFNGISLFSPTSTPDPLYLSNPERGDKMQISRPALGDLNTGDTLKVGNTIQSITFIDHEYQIVNTTFTWHQAKANAESLGGHLATITSQEELNEIISQVPNYGNESVWLGATDENIEGHWEWVTGETWGFTNWESSVPVFNTPDQNYMWSSYNGIYKWDDIRITDTRPGYLLEKDNVTSTQVTSHVGLVALPWSDLQSSIQQVANARAQNGAEQMRLQMEGDLNATNATNLEQALSRIQDVDIAQATSDLSRTKVLIEAGTAMLAQANQSSKSILSLIMQN
jgi:flagellin